MTAIAKTYDPQSVEPRWYQKWLREGAFGGHVESGKEHYCIVIPPPNVTGVLTMGHVLVNSLQDLFIRRARLEGKSVVWMPGTDHASIATHAKVEAALRSEGTSRREIGREAFVRRCWQWSDEHGGLILEQLHKLGASCDWERTVFTMDERYSKAVLHSFVEFYRRGYIYRGKYMTNWCPATQTALSDEEVIMTPEVGVFYTMRYEVVEEPGTYLEISTTRPETLMGDTAVAVHPADERYRHLVGKHVWRPFPRMRIPVIADEVVDREFGTGALKVTPAHDPVDYEIGKRHHLQAVDIMHPDGTLNEAAGEPFAGLDRMEARRVAVGKLREMDLLLREEAHEHIVGYSERAMVPIERRLTDQWWLRYPKVEEAKRAVETGLLQFHPKRWEKSYLHWLNNIKDWCISRQLWWGQRLPVWYRKGADRNDPGNWHVSVEGPTDPENWERDEDVLDTWASSNLWPFATFGWPNANEKERRELRAYYPTEVLVTAFDILFFWVARMIMSGLELYGERKDTLTDDEIRRRLPFRHVYLHGLLRDERGRKFQKSLGNSPDPLDIFHKFGADGTRFGILNMAPSGQDILFTEQRLASGRNFCNKLWNACRFRQMSGPAFKNGSLESIVQRIDWDLCDAFDHWMLARTVATLRDVERQFAHFEVQQMTHTVHNFIWGDFCDWYLEVCKGKSKNEDVQSNCLSTQDLVIRQILLLVHPMIPHITEELWSGLGYRGERKFLQETVLDRADDLESRLRIDHTSVASVELIKEVVTRARALKAEHNLANRRDVTFSYIVKGQDDPISQFDMIGRLAGAAAFRRVERRPENAPAAVTPLGTIFLDLTSGVDPVGEIDRLKRDLEKIQRLIEGAESRLGNEGFLSKAPEEVVEGTRTQLEANRGKRAEIERLLKAI